MSKIEKVIIALGVGSLFPFLYFAYKNIYSLFGLFLSLLPVFFNVALFVLSLKYREKVRLDASKIVADAHNLAKQIVDKANDEISRKKEELLEQQIDLIDKEKRAEAKVEEYKRQMKSYSNALRVKNELLLKIKQIAYAKDREPENKVEEIKKRTYEL